MDFGLLFNNRIEVQNAAPAGVQWAIANRVYNSSDISTAVTNATNYAAISVSTGYPLLRCGCPSLGPSTGVTFTTYNGAPPVRVWWWFGRGTLCHRQNAGHIQFVRSLRPVLRGQRHPYSYRGIDGAHPMILKQLRDDTRGAVLVEFTVTVPFFLLLTFGLIQAGLLLWTQSGLQHGVEYGCSLRER